MQANSNVRVSIGASLSGEFKQAFKEADKQMGGLSKTAAELSKKVNDVQAYRRQQNALQAAGREYKAAKDKAAALRLEIEKNGKATNRQQAELRRAENAVRRTSTALRDAGRSLSDMNRQLERSGTNVNRLSSEYRRLQGELKGAQSRQESMAATMRKQEASLQRQQRLMRGMGTAWRGMQSGIAGGVAGGMVMARPMGKALTYDEQLTYMADTAAGGGSVEEKQAAKVSLSSAVDAALRSGGGKREDAATALNTLVQSGKFNQSELVSALPSVTKAAFAAGASADDMARTAIAMKNFGITDIAGGFDRALRAGQLGNFELRDMARWLPEQLAAARSSGFQGMGGLSEMLAFNQVAMRTAGTQDAAGNNVVNLLNKFTSREFQDAMGKAVKPQKGDPREGGKKGGFDWQGFAMRQRAKGVSSIESFGMILDRQLAGDKRYQAQKRAIADARNPEEKRLALEGAAKIAEGSAVGEIIRDRQALMAGLAYIYGKEEFKEITTRVEKEGPGSVDQSSEFVRGQTFSKVQDSKNRLDRANEETYDSLSGPMGKFLQGVNDLATEFPRLTSYAYGAGVALASLAALGIVGGAAGLATRGGAAATGAGAAAAGGAATAAASKWGLKSLLKKGVKGAGAVGAGMIVADIALPETDLGKGTDSFNRGDYFKASYQMPMIDFFGAIINKLTSEKSSPEVNAALAETSKAAQDAVQAASQAATAAQNRPNVTMHNSYSFTFPDGVSTDPKAQAEAIRKYMQEADRKRAAEARTLYYQDPAY